MSMEHCRMVLTGEKCHFIHHKFRMDWSEIKCGPSW